MGDQGSYSGTIRVSDISIVPCVLGGLAGAMSSISLWIVYFPLLDLIGHVWAPVMLAITLVAPAVAAGTLASRLRMKQRATWRFAAPLMVALGISLSMIGFLAFYLFTPLFTEQGLASALVIPVMVFCAWVLVCLIVDVVMVSREVHRVA